MVAFNMKDTKKIFEYVLSLKDESELQLPAGAQILSVMEQKNEIVLYAIVNTSVEVTKTISVRVVGTGHAVDFDLNEYGFVGTVSLHGGALMFHVFCFDRGYCG
jgi:hypothetical protein